MSEYAKPGDVPHAIVSKGRTHAVEPSSLLSYSSDLEERSKHIVINDGVLAGFQGLRLQNHGTARCLVELKRNGSRLLVEIDENLVEWAD